MKFAIILHLCAILAIALSLDSEDLKKSSDTKSPVIKAVDIISQSDLDAEGSGIFISIGNGGGWGGYRGGWGRRYYGGWGRGYGGGIGIRPRGGWPGWGWGWGK